MSLSLRTGLLCVALAAATAAEDPPLWSGVVELGASHASASDLRDGGGDLAVDESLAEARVYWQPRLGIRLGLGVGGGLHRYDGGPVSTHGELLWVRLPATVMFSQHWGFTSLSSLGTATDGDASASDGRRWQVEAGLLWVRDPDLLIALTAVVTSRVGRGPSVFPLPSLYWRIDDRWSLTVVDEVDNISRLTRTFDARWAASLLVDVRFFEFALAHAAGGAAALDDDRAIVGIEGSWRPFGDPRLAVRPFVGAVVARRLETYDADGGELSSTWVSPTFAAGLSLRAEF